MSGLDTLVMAAKNLHKRKIRTFLTVLGVIAGGGVIIITISLGLAINQGFEERMMTTPNATQIDLSNWGQNPFAPTINDALVERIAQIPNVEAATPWLHFSMRAVIGRRSANLSVIGVNPEALPFLGFEVGEGRNLTSEDEFGILFGTNVPGTFMTQREQDQRNRGWMRMAFFDAEDTGSNVNVDVLSDRIRVSVDWNFGQEASRGFEDGFVDDFYAFFAEDTQTQRPAPVHNAFGVGIMAPGDNWETASMSFMNISTVNRLREEQEQQFQQMGIGGSGVNPADRQNFADVEYNNLRIMVTDVDSIDGVIDELLAMGFSDQWENQNIFWPASFIRELRETMLGLQVLLFAMGGISLFIAAIGIANTMIMSSIERTKEIGVMKAIGASLRDIRNLFLVEATMIGLFGGILGVGLSYLVSHFLNEVGLEFFNFVNMGSFGDEVHELQVSIIPMWLSGLSLLFAAVIGLAAGFLPAQRATRLSALAAIRAD